MHNISSFTASVLLSLAALSVSARGQNIPDNFSSNGLIGGGLDWSGSWSSGTVTNNLIGGDEVLHFNGQGSQSTSRNFDLNSLLRSFDARPSSSPNGAFAGSYTIQFDVAYNIDTSLTGNYGFRMYQGGNNLGTTYGVMWKNESQNNSGQLTFFSSGGNVVVPSTFAYDAQNNSFDVWNITAAQNTQAMGVSYEFTFTVDVLHGQNPDQYRGGTYTAQVVRTLNGEVTHTYNTGALAWANTNNINASGVLNNVTFQSTNNKTNLFISDVSISTGSLITNPVPEPSSAILVLLSFTGFALIRRKRSPR